MGGGGGGLCELTTTDSTSIYLFGLLSLPSIPDVKVEGETDGTATITISSVLESAATYFVRSSVARYHIIHERAVRVQNVFTDDHH